MKYIIIGADPITIYGTTTFSNLKCIGFTESKEEVESIVRNNFDDCAGLIKVFNAEIGEVADV